MTSGWMIMAAILIMGLVAVGVIQWCQIRKLKKKKSENGRTAEGDGYVHYAQSDSAPFSV